MKKISIADARSIAREVASRHPEPRFYRECGEGMEISKNIYDSDPLVLRFREYLEGMGDDFGHGLLHSGLVAVDAGAIVATELGGAEEIVKRDVVLVQVAGLLHDIKRKDKDHAAKGAEEAARLLKDVGLADEEVGIIVFAIANHEAFKETGETADEDGRLISDALYDADKFRWGPDNFTTTLWEMLSFADIDIGLMLEGYSSGMAGVERIKDTFRTNTGKKYGPEFIEIGLRIGREIYDRLVEMRGE
ncbi:MAG: HD domain-containing protein [Deltaproteobacteria bacterium]|uniref:HD domain-containing protein n=1 Tax=Candidatus Zymogenus saltonus TaxID=2844893 RepID=A0A9D8PPM0_9DELT|nr:HD domain-containing protein [Candidatus Zymogenus saltonus]